LPIIQSKKENFSQKCKLLLVSAYKKKKQQSCHVEEGNLFSRQLFNEYRDTSAVGMTAI
jgi:hypothetical protein